MKVVLPEQMGEIDRYTIEKVGIPGIVLMENAALGVVREIVNDLGQMKGQGVCIFAGKGNNGGDALAVARHLHNIGIRVRVYLLTKKENLKEDALTNLQILDNMGIEVNEVLNDEALNEVYENIKCDDIIVDGIFGTGLKGEIEGICREIIYTINKSNVPVLAIDIPSGVNGETGEINGVCIRAYKTCTFEFSKLGHYLYPGCEYAGALVICPIGIPEVSINKFDFKYNVIDELMASKLIPERKRDSNKGNYGKVLVITGSKGMTGAGCLTATSSLRTGAGLIYLGVPRSLAFIYDVNVLESITLDLEDMDGLLSKECIPQIMNKMKNMDVVAIGPGLSTGGDVKEVVLKVLQESDSTLIIDADGLNVLAGNLEYLKKGKNRIITPHPGEMARLTGKGVKEVQRDRIGTALDFSQKWDVITVLKGANTIVASPDGRVFINTTGNSGMATGGTGDVLTGTIAGLAAQGLSPLDASLLGVYLHGLSGDIAARKKGEHGVIASDIVENIPFAMKSLSSQKNLIKDIKL